MTLPLGFGIDALDQLFEQNEGDSPSTKKWTAAIMGPDGCGKSLLALHLAAEYWRRQPHGKKPRIIYVSTDFSYEQADQAWMKFGLIDPESRASVLRRVTNEFLSERQLHADLKSRELLFKEVLKLKKIDPSVEDLKIAIQGSADEHVFFIDLQTQTAGDDWTFLNQILGMLWNDDPKDEVNGTYPLVIVDAVEGLETFVGERDAYGERRTRRSRIAQTVRSAARANAHLVFVLEPVVNNRRLPEQFISDLVVRLRLQHDRDYAFRTIEIEKCRGGWHARGEHEFTIRDGHGTSSGTYLDVDDPRMLRDAMYDVDVLHSMARSNNQDKFFEKQKAKHEEARILANRLFPKCLLSYIHVIPSLHRWNRVLQQEDIQVPEQEGTPLGIPDFGLDRLDDLIGFKPLTKDALIHHGSLTILLGDAGTHKSRLARSFLAQTFASPAEQLRGVAVLISTGLMDRDKLQGRLETHLDQKLDDTRGGPDSNGMDDRILCRRLSVRHLSSAGFLEIVHQNIRAAQFRLKRWLSRLGVVDVEDHDGGSAALHHLIDVKKWGGLIRVVIDDWNVIQATHPNIAEDPLLMQSLVALLKMHNVTALIVSTQPGQPILPATELAPQDLRKVDERHVYTWSVFFFGQRCTAVTADRGNAASPLSMVYEIKPWQESHELTDREKIEADKRDFLARNKEREAFWNERPDLKSMFSEGDAKHAAAKLKVYTSSPTLNAIQQNEVEEAVRFLENTEHRAERRPHEKLVIDPEFALYSGVEEGTPRRVPLVMRLYGGPHATEQGAKAEPHFQRMLRQTFQQIFPTTPLNSVVNFESFAAYDDFFSFADLLDDSRLEHTLIFQVDEFWSAERRSLAILDEYWEKRSVATFANNGRDWIPNKHEDVYSMLQPHPVRPDNIIDRPEPSKSNVPQITGTYNSRKNLDFDVNKKMYVEKIVTDEVFPCRKHLFNRESHPYREKDRVPFLWDFGMIVARRQLWERCKNESLPSQQGAASEPLTIGVIWNSLCLTEDRLKKEGQTEEYMPVDKIEWPTFLDACRLIARHNPGTVPFDVDLHTAESPSCLLLELWASYAETDIHRHWTDECQRRFNNTESLFHELKFRDDLKKDEDGPTLRLLASVHRRSLFAACVQHVSSCSHLDTFDRRLVRRDGSDCFVASRQWYSTSAAIFATTQHPDLCLLRLPGSYSTRGDWFLAMARGSRSQLLGQRALDLLSGRKLSLLRLQDGFGLPCRDILPDAQIGELKTAISHKDIYTGRTRKITYGEICELGAKSIASEGPSRPLSWLWRSRIEKYDRDCFYLRRWIARLYDERSQWLLPELTQSTSQNVAGFLAELTPYAPYEKFCEHLDVLISALR